MVARWLVQDKAGRPLIYFRPALANFKKADAAVRYLVGDSLELAWHHSTLPDGGLLRAACLLACMPEGRLWTWLHAHQTRMLQPASP